MNRSDTLHPTGTTSTDSFHDGPNLGTQHIDESIHADLHSIDPERGWKMILEYGKAGDEKKLGEWKDELANLLTFKYRQTGLFSAVVTGFVVLTLPMLQEDSAAMSAVLLAQISQQLASFSVGAQFANSTIQPSLLEPFVPDQHAVQLNILWISSLVLSVMAAFFTITVQQWLRRVPLPPHLSVREAVRLWRLRHVGLTVWKVPAIISLLPVLVQLSVVLFLVGLYLLLEILHKTTARVLLVLGSSLLGLFFVSAILPLIFIACPYKSPVIPAIASVVQLSLVPAIAGIWVSGVIVGNFIIALIQGTLLISVELASGVVSTIHRVLRSLTCCVVDSGVALEQTRKQARRLAHLRDRIQANGLLFSKRVDHAWMTVLLYSISSGTLWDRWELRYVALRPDFLDTDVLSWAYTRISPVLQDSRLLRPCLQDIPNCWRPKVGTSCINMALIKRYRDVSMMSPEPTMPVFINASSRLPETVSEYEAILWESLPKTWELYEEKETGLPFYTSVPAVICLLYRNKVLGWDPHNEPSRSSVAEVAKTLVEIRTYQSAPHIIEYPKQRLPTALLFGCCIRGYTLSSVQTQDFIRYTIDLFRTLPNLSMWGVTNKVPLCDIVLGTLAIALMGCSSEQAMEDGNSLIQEVTLHEMLKQCAAFLQKHYQDTAFIIRTSIVIPEGEHVLITADVLASITNSMARLMAKGYLAKSPDCPSHSVVRLLRKTCRRAYGDVHSETEQFLHDIDRILQARETDPPPDRSTIQPQQFLVPLKHRYDPTPYYHYRAI